MTTTGLNIPALRAKRIAMELTQSDAAALVGITRTTLSAIERGAYNSSVSIGMALRFSRAYKMPLDAVIDAGEGE
jgi:DNA-binding XRE family transcriptional regulator